MITPDLRHIKVCLLEDDVKSATILKGMLQKLDVKNVTVAHTYRSAVKLYQQNTFDIFLLDINLGESEYRGDHFASLIRSLGFNGPIVYITSYFTENMYENVRDTKPSHFMGKNVSLLELRQALELSLNKISPYVAELTVPNEKSEYFFLKIRNTYQSIKTENISYFFAKNKSSFIRVDGRNYSINSTLKRLEERLDNQVFMRVHKAYLVNMSKIETVFIENDKLQIDNETIPIGYVYRKRVFNKLNIIK